MDRPKWTAVVTGIVSIALAVGYLFLVQVINFRGGTFSPAPIEQSAP